MGSYVLVHGALGGGWQFTGVAQRLRRAGHHVYTPTLTGVGERAHLASPEVGLDTHVRDVAATFECEGIVDAVLVGADYGGVVITAAAEELAGRISSLVYVAALIPRAGLSTMDLLPSSVREYVRALAREYDGWRIPTDERFLDMWGLNDPVQRAWVKSRRGAFPLRCWEQPTRLPADAAAAALPREYVELVGANPAVFGPSATLALDQGWGYHRIQADHAAWITAPDLMTAALQTCDSSRLALEPRTPHHNAAMAAAHQGSADPSAI